MRKVILVLLICLFWVSTGFTQDLGIAGHLYPPEKVTDDVFLIDGWKLVTMKSVDDSIATYERKKAKYAAEMDAKILRLQEIKAEIEK